MRNRGGGTIARLLLAWLAGLVLSASVEARSIVDSAGRVVELPDTVTRVFASGPPASILIYALKPSALLGWPRELRGYEKPYIAPALRTPLWNWSVARQRDRPP